jgi:hypothetical protein
MVNVAATAPDSPAASLPYHLIQADLNGDGQPEFLQFGANKLFGFSASAAATPMLHQYYRSDIIQLVVGHFTPAVKDHRRDDVCAVLASGDLTCMTTTADGHGLLDWFSQPSFIRPGDEPMVADFGGDGVDDILVYRPSTGALNMYTRDASGRFGPMPRFGLGNLRSADRIGKQFFVGEFGQASNRADLLMVDPATGQVSRYDSATDPKTGIREFWWAFTTRAGAVPSGTDLAVARLDTGAHDEIVLRNRASGRTRIARAEFGPDQGLVSLGTTTVFGTSRGRLLFLRRAGTRSDALLFGADGTLTRWDAAGEGWPTYVRAYQKTTPRLDQGWHGALHDKWSVVICHVDDPQYAGRTMKYGKPAFWKNEFSLDTPDSLARYFWDVTYGSIDISHPTVVGPVTATPPARQHWDTVGINSGCAAAAHLGSDAGRILVYSDSDGFQGWPGGLTIHDVQPGHLLETAILHEMGHAMGLQHAGGDNPVDQYGDAWSLMGYTVQSADCPGFDDRKCGGTGLNAAERIKLATMPTREIATLVPNGTRRKVSLNLGGLDRPEATTASYLAIQIPLPPGVDPTCAAMWRKNGVHQTPDMCSAPGRYLTVEYRQPTGWDSRQPTSGVQIHKALPSQDIDDTILMNAANPSLQAGASYVGSGVTIHVDALGSTGATVTITY